MLRSSICDKHAAACRTNGQNLQNRMSDEGLCLGGPLKRQHGTAAAEWPDAPRALLAPAIKAQPAPATMPRPWAISEPAPDPETSSRLTPRRSTPPPRRRPRPASPQRAWRRRAPRPLQRAARPAPWLPPPSRTNNVCSPATVTQDDCRPAVCIHCRCMVMRSKGCLQQAHIQAATSIVCHRRHVIGLHLLDDVLVIQRLERDGHLPSLVRQRHAHQVLQRQQLPDLQVWCGRAVENPEKGNIDRQGWSVESWQPLGTTAPAASPSVERDRRHLSQDVLV